MSTFPIAAVTRAGTTDGSSAIAPNSYGAASATAGTTELGRDAFLQLLVAQLKYQDPSSPADASSLIAQSSQLAMVDKLDTIATSLDQSGLAARMNLATGLIGQRVAFTDADGYLTSATVTSVRFDGTDTFVQAGDTEVPLALVLGVAGPTTPAASTATSTSTSTSSITGAAG